jgi:hypothetical protein
MTRILLHLLKYRSVLVGNRFHPCIAEEGQQCDSSTEYYAYRTTAVHQLESIFSDLAQLPFNVALFETTIGKSHLFDQIITLNCLVFGLLYNKQTLQDVRLLDISNQHVTVSVFIKNAVEMKFGYCTCPSENLVLKDKHIKFRELFNKCFVSDSKPSHLLRVENQPWKTSQAFYNKYPDLYVNANNVIFCSSEKEKSLEF